MDRPNIIVILCDQLRAFETGCYGNDVIQTPTIERLAQNGVRFETAVTNNPVCTPARSVLLSGQYTRCCSGSLANDADTPPALERTRLCDPTLPEVLLQAGYRTGLVGKWHIHPHPLKVGFQQAFFPNHNHRYSGQSYLRDYSAEEPVEGYSPEVELAEVARFISEDKQEPFFLYYNISQPHMPLCDAPERYLTMYNRDEVSLRDNVWHEGKLAIDPWWFQVYRWAFKDMDDDFTDSKELPADFDLRDMIALYYGLVSWVDDQVAALLNILQEKGITDETLIIFTSDHGDNLGSHQLFNKDWLIEEGLRIPLIFHCPALLSPLVNDTQVASLVDIMPTILALLGVEIPPTVQGTDLSSVIRGEELTTGENLAFIETDSGEIGVRTPRFLYGMRMDGNWQDARPLKIIDECYKLSDLQNDPLESKNVIAEPDMQIVCYQLRERLRRWDAETPWLKIHNEC